MQKLFPDLGFLGEEGTAGSRPTGGRYFVVDPIDGTTNFIHGLPHYCISLAYKEQGRTVLGAVYVPYFDDFYHAMPGQGACRNGERIRVSRTTTLINALGATGFACVRQRVANDNVPIFSRAIYELRGVRRLGSAAIDMCMVAEGKFDLYWEINIRPWDIAAGALLVQEAGGRVTDLDGGSAYEERDQVVGSNGLLHEAFLDLVRQVRATTRHWNRPTSNTFKV